MYSPTEERLRTFIEKLSEALTEEVEVIVRPGDNWAAYPKAKPPILTFRLADVAVIGDEILSVTAHEIAHLLYTDVEITWHFDVSKKPRAAHLLLNAVEDSRIERVFSDAFPGARSLFDRKQDNVYDYKVQRGFPDLPIKWRYILNIDRVLHGLEPWGDARDLEAVEKALDDCLAAMWADSTQEAADCLARPYIILLELMKQEQDEQAGKKMPQQQTVYIDPDILEAMGMPTDYMPNHPMDDEDEQGGNGQQSAVQHPGAQQDDHKQGGSDGTPGKREKADGGAAAGGAKGEGSKGQGKGRSPAGVKDGSSQDGEGVGGAGGSGTGFDDRYKDLDPEKAPDDKHGTGAKPTNIIEEMVEEEKARGSRNKTIDILSYRQRHREREAKEVEKKIRREQDAFWDELNKLWRQGKSNQAFREQMAANEARYRRDKAELAREIGALRNHARNVLRDNAMHRFGGNHTSGRKIKTHRLSRLFTDDPRLFQKKEEVGGKSYDIALVVDQSASMRGLGKQELAYKAALIFLEAFEGLVGTSVIGFSDLGYATDDSTTAAMVGGHSGRFRQRHNWSYRSAIDFRTYKAVDDQLRRRYCTIPALAQSYNSTPLEAGVNAAIAQLRDSQKEVKAIVLITDGEPNDPVVAARALKEARRLGIETYALHIGGRSSYGNLDAGFPFLAQNCDHAVQLDGTASIPTAVYRLLRGVVRGRRAAVA